MQYSPHQWSLLKLQKVIDYIEGYCILFGSGVSRYEVSLVWCLSIGEACWALVCYLHVYQISSPKFAEGARWSFLPFKIESV